MFRQGVLLLMLTAVSIKARNTNEWQMCSCEEECQAQEIQAECPGGNSISKDDAAFFKICAELTEGGCEDARYFKLTEAAVVAMRDLTPNMVPFFEMALAAIDLGPEETRENSRFQEKGTFASPFDFTATDHRNQPVYKLDAATFRALVDFAINQDTEPGQCEADGQNCRETAITRPLTSTDLKANKMGDNDVEWIKGVKEDDNVFYNVIMATEPESPFSMPVAFEVSTAGLAVEIKGKTAEQIRERFQLEA